VGFDDEARVGSGADACADGRDRRRDESRRGTLKRAPRWLVWVSFLRGPLFAYAWRGEPHEREQYEVER